MPFFVLVWLGTCALHTCYRISNFRLPLLGMSYDLGIKPSDSCCPQRSVWRALSGPYVRRAPVSAISWSLQKHRDPTYPQSIFFLSLVRRSTATFDALSVCKPNLQVEFQAWVWGCLNPILHYQESRDPSFLVSEHGFMITP